MVTHKVTQRSFYVGFSTLNQGSGSQKLIYFRLLTPRDWDSDRVMADDDYESLPESSAISAHMLAGAAAGISEHCLMYPVDCVKVRI